MKTALTNTLLFAGSLLMTLLALEGAAQFYVAKIAERGKLFEPDEVTGWRVKPHLDIQRKNANGDIWVVRTDKEGFRISDKRNVGTKVLILGDSFAFGEGVDIEDRFDAVINDYGYSVLNTGVMGFGTDQQFLKAQPYLAELDENDIVLVLTYFNDFYDIMRKTHSGRVKPWFTMDGDALQLHKPKISLQQVLRDKSYIYAMYASLTARGHADSRYNIEHASRIYQNIVSSLLQRLTPAGVRVVVAFHGIPHIQNAAHKGMILKSLNTTCEQTNIKCLSLDQYIVDNDQNFLVDMHWSKKGHETVGLVLLDSLSNIAEH